uniref:Endonuclease/exonuclease/phosphatase domain-containing protein n=1 Tax=Kalanchoe fedtschenkoi TaxID=63787 RepID=A0A7N0VJS1_KALFE
MIYAFNQIQYRAPLWSELTSISQSMSDPWVLLGDFNCLLSTQDRIGFPVAMRETTELNDFFSNYGISDIPHSGFKYTWSNKRYSSSIIHCKLDRVCCNDQWIAAFPDSHAVFSPPGISDHCPGILKIPQLSTPPKLKRRFQFCNAWTLQESFLETVRTSWSSTGPCNDLFHAHLKLKTLRSSLLSAYASSTSKISERVQTVRDQLKDTQNMLINNPADSLLQDLS